MRFVELTEDLNDNNTATIYVNPESVYAVVSVREDRCVLKITGGPSLFLVGSVTEVIDALTESA